MSDVFAADGSTKAPAAEENSNPLEALVGEGKKFKSVEDLARGKAEADAHIARLESEMAELRKDLGKSVDAAAQLNELRDELKALRTANPQASRDNTSPALTVDGIKALVNESLTQAERNRTAQQNIQKANDAMVQHFGSLEKASEAVKARAAVVGLSVQDLQLMAAKSPTAFQKIMLDGAEKSDGPLNPQSAVREVPAGGFEGGKPKEGTKAYFDDLRKTDPKRYWKPETQEAIIRAAKAGTYQL